MATQTTPALTRFYSEHKAALWAILTLLPLVVVAVGVWAAPGTFYDNFVWKHLWGPIVADAQQTGRATHNGITAVEGYTLVSEVVYGLALATILFGVYRLVIQRFRVKADGWFIVALIPYILLGPLTRALEDAWVFVGPSGEPSPLAYLFISPIIYLHVAVYAVGFLLLGAVVERAADRVGYQPGDTAPRSLGVMLGLVAAPLAAMVAAYAGAAALYGDTLSAVAPPVVVLMAALLAFALYAYGLEAWGPSKKLVLFTMGVPLVAPALFLVGRWVAGDFWADVPTWRGALYPEAAAASIGLAAAVTIIVYLAARSLGKDAPTLAIYAAGVNLALIFGHMLDGFATYIAIKDPFAMGIAGYGEKHPVSDYFLGIGDGIGFPVLKLIMIGLIIFLLDREFDAEDASAEEKNLVGLVKMAIFVLGFAPGVRDIARVTMGL